MQLKTKGFCDTVKLCSTFHCIRNPISTQPRKGPIEHNVILLITALGLNWQPVCTKNVLPAVCYEKTNLLKMF